MTDLSDDFCRLKSVAQGIGATPAATHGGGRSMPAEEWKAMDHPFPAEDDTV
ncbi:hypothetical protein [Rhizobium leguminosarum]|uniref:hypothetical protein n=1 Tax=Rhizobium leguminosarum TaxID=384 RepID=UPI0016759AB1|nr:hypothetical protein [Rhizobium leguminosarum]